MKINLSGFDAYQNIVKGTQRGESAVTKKTSTASSSAANTDKVTFSESAAARAELHRLAASISAEVDGVGSEERLATLQKQIQAGSYNVPTQELADAILGYVAD